MYPLFLVSQFEELNYQTEYQVYRINDSLGFVESIQALSRDQRDGANLSVSDKLEELTKRKKRHKALCEKVNSKVAETAELSTLSDKMVRISSDTNNDAAVCNSKCSQALQNATNAEVAAANDLGHASSIASHCHGDVVSAQHKLDIALRELDRRSRETRTEYYKVGDKNYTRQVPVDTTSERMAVSSARSSLSSANSAYNVALKNQERARDLLNAATARVVTCRAALSLSDEVIVDAKELLEDSDYAQIKVKTALKSIDDIAQKCDAISRLYALVAELAEHATVNIIDLNTCIENEYSLVQVLRRSLDTFERSSFILRQALDDKTSLLLSFNQPITRL